MRWYSEKSSFGVRIVALKDNEFLNTTDLRFGEVIIDYLKYRLTFLLFWSLLAKLARTTV